MVQEQQEGPCAVVLIHIIHRSCIVGTYLSKCCAYRHTEIYKMTHGKNFFDKKNPSNQSQVQYQLKLGPDFVVNA